MEGIAEMKIIEPIEASHNEAEFAGRASDAETKAAALTIQNGKAGRLGVADFIRGIVGQ